MARRGQAMAAVMGVLVLALLGIHTVWAATSDGVYHLWQPERGASQVQMKRLMHNGRDIMAVASCEKCPPAVYQFQAEPSAILKRDVFFNSMGLYLIADTESRFWLVQADAELGRAVWQKLGYLNVYSKNQADFAKLNLAEQQQQLLALSASMMNQDVGTITGGDGEYFLAVPEQVAGSPRDSMTVTFSRGDKPSITIVPCAKCRSETYQYLPEASAAAEWEIYGEQGSQYLFDIKDGILLKVVSQQRLGRGALRDTDTFNVLSTNKAYLRQILADGSKQQAIDQLLKTAFVKAEQDQQQRDQAAQAAAVAAQQLPKSGFDDNHLNGQLLAAAQRWAAAWQWSEQLKQAYPYSADWQITHHPLSGAVTGRKLSAVLTMLHPDGRCRFQYVGMAQDFDGQQYSNLRMTGVGIIKDIPCERLP